MILDGDEIIRMKFSVLKAAIFPFKIKNNDVIKTLSNFVSDDDYEGAHEYLSQYIRDTINYKNIVLKKYPQVIRTAVAKHEVSIGFEVNNKNELNKIKISNYSLAEQIRSIYDIRM